MQSLGGKVEHLRAIHATGTFCEIKTRPTIRGK